MKCPSALSKCFPPHSDSIDWPTGAWVCPPFTSPIKLFSQYSFTAVSFNLTLKKSFCLCEDEWISASENAARAKCVFWNVNQMCVCVRVCAALCPAPDLRRSSRFLNRVWSRCSASSWSVSWSQNTLLQTAIRISMSSTSSLQPYGPSEEPCSRIRWIWYD